MENENIREKGFTEREILGREKLKRLYKKKGIEKYEFTQGVYDPWDSSYTGNSGTYNVEIKDKDEPLMKWYEKGIILEKKKYVPMIKAYEETDSEPLYINFFQDGEGFWANLLDITPKWVWKLCTKTSANGTYGMEKEWKEVTFIMPKEGHRFKYE